MARGPTTNEQPHELLNADGTDTTTSASRRLKIALMFALGFVVSLPVWWYSTAVEHAELPHERIGEWAARDLHSQVFPIGLDVRVFVVSSSEGDAQSLQGLLDGVKSRARIDGVNRQGYRARVKYTVETASDVVGVDASASDDDLMKLLPEHVSRRNIGDSPAVWVLVDESLTDETGSVGYARDAWIRVRGVSTPLAHTIDLLATSKFVLQRSEQDTMRAITPVPSYMLTFNLLNADGAHSYNWNFDWALERFLSPLINCLSSLADWDVHATVQHYVPIQSEPERRGEEYIFQASQLPHVINPNEWNLDFTATDEKSLNFIAYVPDAQHTPTHIWHDDSTPTSTDAYLIPRTGGVAFVNRHKTNNSAHIEPMAERELSALMCVFVSQLRELVGLSPSPLYTPVPLSFLPHPINGITDWELDALERARVEDNVVTARKSLRSLSLLVEKMDTIPVSEDIQHSVVAALDALDLTMERLNTQDTRGALRASRRALELALDSFFHPSMLQMLYFPDEHKYAIYSPLFVPTIIPTVLAVFREFKALRAMRAAKAKID